MWTAALQKTPGCHAPSLSGPVEACRADGSHGNRDCALPMQPQHSQRIGTPQTCAAAEITLQHALLPFLVVFLEQRTLTRCLTLMCLR